MPSVTKQELAQAPSSWWPLSLRSLGLVWTASLTTAGTSGGQSERTTQGLGPLWPKDLFSSLSWSHLKIMKALELPGAWYLCVAQMLKGGVGKGVWISNRVERDVLEELWRKSPFRWAWDLWMGSQEESWRSWIVPGAEDAVQTRDADGLDQDGRSGVGQKRSKSVCILFPQKNYKRKFV